MANSEEEFIYLNSEAHTLEIVGETYPPVSQKIGVPFTIQPKVRILDKYGAPISGKYVIAISWPEPFTPRPGHNENQEAYIDGF